MIGLLITARMGSSRLPRKHLIEACGKPLLFWLIKRFEKEFEKEIKNKEACIIIASSDEPANKEFSKAIEGTSCTLFQGSDNNIPLRHLQCGKKYNLNYIISIDGDDILCSTYAARKLVDAMKNNSTYNYFSTSGLPIGMNVSGYSVAYLDEMMKNQNVGKIETGWGRVFIEPKTYNCSLGNYDIMGDLRFTLDYNEDAVFFCEVINSIKERTIDITDVELISFVQKSGLYKINKDLKEVYWENYNTEKSKEI